METLEGSSVVRHTTIPIETQHPTHFVDLTETIRALVEATGIQTGLVNVQSLHTTAAIVVNEHEPLLLMDMTELLERMAPRQREYRHDDVGLRSVNCILGERPNGHSHCRALLLPAAVCLNVVNGQLHLGRWQRVFLAELDGPQWRRVSLLILGEAGR